MAKSTANLQLARAKSNRPYKSRAQRPCDFCRRRKTCCIIEGSVPCTPCIQFNKSKCTFNEGPMKRNSKQEKKPLPKLDQAQLIGRLLLVSLAPYSTIPDGGWYFSDYQSQPSAPSPYVMPQVLLNVAMLPLQHITELPRSLSTEYDALDAIRPLQIVQALDLVRTELQIDAPNSCVELSSLLSSTSPEVDAIRLQLSLLSRLSKAIFTVILNSPSVSTVALDSAGLQPLAKLGASDDVDHLTNSSVYSSTEFSPSHRTESLSSVNTKNWYNYQHDTALMQPMELDEGFRDISREHQFDDHYPVFLFSPESDIF